MNTSARFHRLGINLEKSIFSILRAIYRFFSAFKQLKKNPFHSKTTSVNLEHWKRMPVFVSSGELIGHLDSVYAAPRGDKVELTYRGWIFHQTQKIKKVTLPALGDALRIELHNLSRNDVFSAFPSISNAQNSGFAITAEIPAHELPSSADPIPFNALLENGRSLSGNFDSYTPTIFPVLPWTDKDPILSYTEEEYLPFRDKSIVITSSNVLADDLKRSDLYFWYSDAEVVIPSALQTFSPQVITDIQSFTLLIARARHVAKQIALVGEKPNETYNRLEHLRGSLPGAALILKLQY